MSVSSDSLWERDFDDVAPTSTHMPMFLQATSLKPVVHLAIILLENDHFFSVIGVLSGVIKNIFP